jgi:hypothetical protein
MIASQITTPTVVQNTGGRIGVCIYDNPLVTNNANKSAYVIYSDGTYKQEKRNDLTQVGTATGAAAFTASNEGIGPGN